MIDADHRDARYRTTSCRMMAPVLVPLFAFVWTLLAGIGHLEMASAEPSSGTENSAGTEINSGRTELDEV